MAPALPKSIAILIALFVSDGAEGFSFCNKIHQPVSVSCSSSQRLSKTANNDRIRNRGSLSMYLPPETTTQTAPMVSQRILKSPSATGGKSVRPSMSSSVLAASDTLPCFPTAHGVLSPEIVQRMDEMTSAGNQRQEKEIVRFLDTYRNHGPMACLPMLSDPCVLPKLTEAMRDIA